MSKFSEVMEGGIKQELHYQNHTDTLTARLTQPAEKIILERNAQLRKNPGSIRDLGQVEGKNKTHSQTWGRLLCSIPNLMYAQAIKAGFAMDSSDSKLAEKEINRFLLTDEGKQCLIR